MYLGIELESYKSSSKSFITWFGKYKQGIDFGNYSYDYTGRETISYAGVDSIDRVRLIGHTSYKAREHLHLRTRTRRRSARYSARRSRFCSE